jgi:hypothetical protein
MGPFHHKHHNPYVHLHHHGDSSVNLHLDAFCQVLFYNMLLIWFWWTWSILATVMFDLIYHFAPWMGGMLTAKGETTTSDPA